MGGFRTLAVAAAALARLASPALSPSLLYPLPPCLSLPSSSPARAALVVALFSAALQALVCVSPPFLSHLRHVHLIQQGCLLVLWGQLLALILFASSRRQQFQPAARSNSSLYSPIPTSESSLDPSEPSRSTRELNNRMFLLFVVFAAFCMALFTLFVCLFVESEYEMLFLLRSIVIAQFCFAASLLLCTSEKLSDVSDRIPLWVFQIKYILDSGLEDPSLEMQSLPIWIQIVLFLVVLSGYILDRNLTTRNSKQKKKQLRELELVDNYGSL